MNYKQIITTSLGNTLEWFDFGLFIFMAPLIGAKFFPQQSASLATLEALMVFAAGFICRPLGGIFFGHFGDTRGRAKTLRVSILLITVSTILVGILPSYQTIGIAAPIIFTLLRLIQGISIGGEYSGVMIYLAESAPPTRRGFVTSFSATGANIGFLAATLIYVFIKIVFSEATIMAWAWRLPFLLVGIPGTIILYYRFKLPESRVYQQLAATHHLASHPFLTAIKSAPWPLLKILGLTCMSSSFYYVFFGFMPTYLERYIGIPSKTALLFQSILLTCMLFLVPLAGLLGDYLTRKRLLLLTAISIMLFAYPAFYLLQTQSLIAIFCTLFIAALISSCDQGNSLTAVVENCPENIRYSGIAFSYNLGMALFGGTAPLIISLLTEHLSLIAPAYYLLGMAFISFLAAATLLPGNKVYGFIKATV